MKNILIVLSLFIFACSNGQQKGFLMNAEEFKKGIESDKNAVVLDVRTPKEFGLGRIPNAVNIDWNSRDAEEQLAKLDPSKTYYVYCLSGGRSASAVDYLKSSGFKNVYELNGGIMKWRGANFPEEKENTGDVHQKLTLEQFNELVKSDKVVVVDFFAEWCGPCKKMAPYLADMQKNMSDKIKIVKIDADLNVDLCKALGIDALPTLYVYKNNQRSFTHVGYLSREDLEKEL